MNNLLDEVIESSINLIEKLSAVERTERRDIIYDYLKCRKTDVSVGDFKEGLEWFNVSRPLTLQTDLKGKIVILDFFTYCCINCLHILPALKELEDEHSVESGVVVIGVHSAKFDNEKDSGNIFAAIKRYRITHPVVNDANGTMWNALGIPCWPTLLVLSPEGKPIFVAVGESNTLQLREVVREAVVFFREGSGLSNSALPLSVHANIVAPGFLLYPGKVACTGTDNATTIAIADTGHHRVIVCSESGEVKWVIGGEGQGFVDGDLNVAKFCAPQGLAFTENHILYVADTENNAIRKIDLNTKSVSTVYSNKDKEETKDTLSSPWDLCVVRDKNCLLIAAAGNHQIWALFLQDVTWWRNAHISAGTCIPIAGTGREENRNNMYPHAAAFAQPSGLCFSPALNSVFIADSESSSIRRLDLSQGKVTAVVGGGRSPTDLFCFGDVDGHQWDVRLQHPLGVAWCPAQEGSLFVVDSYNHKLKKIMPEERTCCTFLGTGVAGDSLAYRSEQLSEPGGICSSPCGKYLYIADTNNHSIKVVSLNCEDSSHRTTKLDVRMPSPSRRHEDVEICNEWTAVVNPSGGVVTWTTEIELESGLSYTNGAPQRWSLQLPKVPGLIAHPSEGDYALTGGRLEVQIKVCPRGSERSHRILLFLSAFTCDNDNLCRKQRYCASLQISYKDEASEATCCKGYIKIKKE